LYEVIILPFVLYGSKSELLLRKQHPRTEGSCRRLEKIACQGASYFAAVTRYHDRDLPMEVDGGTCVAKKIYTNEENSTWKT
jgi:hypothetical protein